MRLRFWQITRLHHFGCVCLSLLSLWSSHCGNGSFEELSLHLHNENCLLARPVGPGLDKGVQLRRDMSLLEPGWQSRLVVERSERKTGVSETIETGCHCHSGHLCCACTGWCPNASSKASQSVWCPIWLQTSG